MNTGARVRHAVPDVRVWIFLQGQISTAECCRLQLCFDSTGFYFFSRNRILQAKQERHRNVFSLEFV